MQSIQTLRARFAQSGQSNVCYRIGAAGKPPVVFIHGAGCDHRIWTHQLDAFSERYTPLLIDLPGHGQSDHPTIRYEMTMLADSVNAVLEQEHLSEVILVGQSMGALVCRKFLEHYPGKVRAVVSVDGSFHQVRYPLAAVLAIQLMRTPLYLKPWQRFVSSLLTRSPEPLVQLMQETAMNPTPHVVRSLVHELYRSASQRPADVTVPLLAAISQGGNFDSPAARQAILDIAPHAAIETIDAGHLLMYEKPEEFNTIVLAFLARLRNNVSP